MFAGSAFATGMFIWGIFSLFDDFRLRVLQMRLGIYPEGLNEVPLIQVTPLTGFIFANSLVTFIFNFFWATLLFIPVFWILTY